MTERQRVHERELSCLQRAYVSYKTSDECIDTQSASRQWLAQALNSWPVAVWMTLLTLWALFAEDFKVATTNRGVDPVFSWIAFGALLCFFAEWLLSSFAIRGYLLSFFFWLDIVATLSLITDVAFIASALGFGDSGSVDPSSARAGRAARAGTRATRIIRLVRLLRVGKLWKQVAGWFAADAEDAAADEEFEDLNKPSNLGAFLSQLITQRVIVGVLAVVLVVPWLLSSQNDGLYPLGSDVLALSDVWTHAGIAAIDKQSFRQQWLEDNRRAIAKKQLAWLSVDGNETQFQDLDHLRYDEVESFEEGVVHAVFDIETVRVEDAWKSVALTCFLIFMLSVLALVFTADIDTYVLRPINAMTSCIDRMIKDPMSAAKASAADGADAGFETEMLRGTVARIGQLLGMGFGVAGSRIISSSLSSALDSKVADGRDVEAVFGFADIRNFTDATECLQTEVMNYVNDVASVVHGVTVQMGGAPNKNVGDAFLLVWDLSAKTDSVERMLVADSAMAAVIKIIIQIMERNQNEYLKYRRNARVIQRLGDDWEVALGWGLHLGTAIEGALGSRYKIDASYLSAHVNLAEDLEAATKFYSAPFLMSQQFYDCLSPVGKFASRHVDTIRIAGIRQPFNLYTCDLWKWHANRLTKRQFEGRRVPAEERGFGLLSTRLQTIEEMHGKVPQQIADFWFKDFELNQLLTFTPVKHRVLWHKALKHYLAGRWLQAAKYMRGALSVLPSDGSATALLQHMQQCQLQAPRDWRGVREHH